MYKKINVNNGKSAYKISWSNHKISGFMGKNVSVGGKQFAKLRNLKFYNFCSTQAMELKFSADLTY